MRIGRMRSLVEGSISRWLGDDERRVGGRRIRNVVSRNEGSKELVNYMRMGDDTRAIGGLKV